MSSSPYDPQPYVRLTHPEWTRDAVLYQVNTRQFTPEGTFAAAERELPRLLDLGVTILWLMPVHEIGEVNRKGELGSPYAVRDYYSVNPEHGTLDDLKHFVAAAHDLGLKVILDWVAHHTAWDCDLVEVHPEWYARDHAGRMHPTPWWDWDDIVDLDYTQPALREWMTEALVWWVREVDIDGYRCDVAGFVPVDFWAQVRRELEAVKPVFLLAEWESRDLHADAFDASYAWTWYDDLHRIARGDLALSALNSYYSWNQKFWPPEAMRMMFVSNHDKNSWEGTEFEMFGEAREAAIVLSTLGEGIPLVYNGQEAGNEKRLAFFDRDPIAWREHPQGDLYRRLLALRRARPALGNAPWGDRMRQVVTSAPDEVLAFTRGEAGARVLVALNFSAEHLRAELHDLDGTTWTDWVDGATVDRTDGLPLESWGWRVLLEA